ncbi:MAG: FG-GAP repeat protein [Phycisphaerales bacterium]|nr:FG-GAP repeat protein [Phycisphaerales bacterium]
MNCKSISVEVEKRSQVHSNLVTRLAGLMLAVVGTLCPSSVFAQEAWQEMHKLSIPGIRANAVFGHAVDIHGDRAVIGAPGGPNSGTWPGRAYIFDSETGTLLFTLIASDRAAEDRFGFAVGIVDDVVVTGAPLSDDALIGPNTGSAYVFDASAGSELYRLLASDRQPGDQFGYSVAVSGSHAIIGAPFDDQGAIFSHGSVYVFDLTTGQQLRKIVAPDRADGDFFGWSVSLDGNIAVIGAPGDDDNGSASGSAYVFDIITGQRILKLLASDGQSSDQFGVAVAVSGNCAVIGMDDVPFNTRGAAYVFDLTTGQEMWRLQPSDGDPGADQFGKGVALHGNRAIVGSEQNVNRGLQRGAAYVFDILTGVQVLKVLAADSASGDVFGNAVVIQGTRMIVGAQWNDEQGTDTGAAYLFQGIPNLLASPDPLESGQDATFSTTNLTPNQPAYLAYSVRGPGSVFFPPLNITIDLLRPKQIGPAMTTNVNGQAQWTLHVPPSGNPVPVWFQVVQFENKTNVVATQIEP